MQNIREYLDYLYKFERLKMKYDLSNIKKILKALGNPERELKCIHIAGTNGKGAAASFAASVLMEHGLRTGLFTSPHIIKFNERIRVNGKQIDNNYIKNFIKKNLKLFKKIKPSFFEVNTAMAFSYFRDKKTDAAVIECGLGGRLDSTNVITPFVSIITQIAKDHEKYLGNTLYEIAKEKLGIVKKNIPVVVCDNNPALKKLFYKHIDNSILFYLDELYQGSHIVSATLCCGTNKIIPFTDKTQLRNAMASVIACEIFLRKNKLPISIASIKQGLKNIIKNTGYHCRIEKFKKDGYEFIFDAAHNPEAIKNTFENLNKVKIDVIVFGMMEDKDYKSCLPYILKLSDNIIFTKPSYHRSLEPINMLTEAMKQNKNENYFISGSVKDAVKIVYQMKKSKKRVLFCGSFFLVSDALKVLKLQKYIN